MYSGCGTVILLLAQVVVWLFAGLIWLAESVVNWLDSRRYRAAAARERRPKAQPTAPPVAEHHTAVRTVCPSCHSLLIEPPDAYPVVCSRCGALVQAPDMHCPPGALSRASGDDQPTDRSVSAAE